MYVCMEKNESSCGQVAEGEGVDWVRVGADRRTRLGKIDGYLCLSYTYGTYFHFSPWWRLCYSLQASLAYH